MIAIVDYGMGNLRSVEKALQAAGARVVVTSSPADLLKCGKIVLPGVGAFGDAMSELKRLSLDKAIKSAIEKGKPFLGLCLGLQLLFEKSDEAPGVKGLGVFKGEVKRFKFAKKCNLKVPHMGWNTIKANSVSRRKYKILDSIDNGSFVYFVHSYYVKPKDKAITFTTTDYGINFTSGVARDNVYGFQFHPEKSQDVGLGMLENFVKL